jgi:regulatory protein
VAHRTRTSRERRAAAEQRLARRAEVTEPDVVMEAAAAFLAVRPRSVEETRRRLNHLGYPSTLVDQVIDRLVHLDYLDDEGFARAWVESRDRARPRGAVALRRELQQKGVPDEVISGVLEERALAVATVSDHEHDESGDPDRAAALRLLQRRVSSLRREADPRRRRQKAYALLARNGFAPDVCHDVASTLSEAEPD